MHWVVLGESATGTSHRAGNVPCQDAFRFRMFGSEGEWLVIAAADGAGSASHAEVGAAFVCDGFVRRCEVGGPNIALTRDSMTDLFADVRSALLAQAASLEVPPRELACTALLAVVGPSSATFAQLGDGAIVVGQGGEHRAVFWPEPAEYVNTTDFLTDDQFANALRFDATSDPIDEVAGFTDGLQRLALDFTTRVPHAPFFRPLFSELRSSANPESLIEPFRKFLDSERVNQRTDDDKTLVFAVRRS